MAASVQRERDAVAKERRGLAEDLQAIQRQRDLQMEGAEQWLEELRQNLDQAAQLVQTLREAQRSMNRDRQAAPDSQPRQRQRQRQPQRRNGR